jgi:hypothetical protein
MKKSEKRTVKGEKSKKNDVANLEEKKRGTNDGRQTVGELMKSDPVKFRQLFISDSSRKFWLRMALADLMRGEQSNFGSCAENLVVDGKLKILAEVTGDKVSIALWLAVLEIADRGIEPTKSEVFALAESRRPKLFQGKQSKRTQTNLWKKAQLKNLLEETRGRDRPLNGEP